MAEVSVKGITDSISRALDAQTKVVDAARAAAGRPAPPATPPSPPPPPERSR